MTWENEHDPLVGQVSLCQQCGSLSPEDFVRLVAEGHETDVVYVHDAPQLVFFLECGHSFNIRHVGQLPEGLRQDVFDALGRTTPFLWYGHETQIRFTPRELFN